MLQPQVQTCVGPIERKSTACIGGRLSLIFRRVGRRNRIALNGSLLWSVASALRAVTVLYRSVNSPSARIIMKWMRVSSNDTP